MYLPYVATTLNNLGILYSDSERMEEAEEAYSEALATRRKLAETNPEAYLPAVATTLHNVAVVYRNTRRIDKAEEAYAEALAIRRKLAEADPEAYLPSVAGTLNNLAVLYGSRENGCGPEVFDGGYGDSGAALAGESRTARQPDC